MKNEDVRNIDAALAALRKLPLRPKLAFRVAHTINRLMPTFDAITDQESKIREKYLFVDPRTKQAERNEDNSVKFRDGMTREQFDTEMLELFETESDVALPATRFKLKDFEESGMPVSPDTLLLLGELVVFEDEEPTTPEKGK
jgi:hypothetical protein